jgi:exodeoxyribonuclease VII small subunit
MLEEAVDEGVDASFEDIYQRLGQAVGRLETGGLSLEESIELYETGMRLARRCKEMLDAAELRVSELQQEFSSDLVEVVDDNEVDVEAD